MLMGLSSGNFDGSFVGGLPNSYAIQDGLDLCWLNKNIHRFEWSIGAIKPECWNRPGDVCGCGILLNAANKLSIFFTRNGMLMGQCTFMTHN
jgi:hypothetical protein